MISVHPHPATGAWVAVCTDHGVLPWAWTSQTHAALDAMGHAAAHHTEPRIPA